MPGAGTRYLFGIDKFHIDSTRAQFNDTDHVTLTVKIGDQIQADLPVKHMGDVSDGDHTVGLYYLPPFELPNLDTVVTFNYLIANIGTGDYQYQAIEDGLRAAAVAGLTAVKVPYAEQIVAIAAALFHFFVANCDGPVAIHQVTASGHLLNAWTAAHRVHKETKSDTFPGQFSCGNPQYNVTWSIVRL